LFLTETRRHGGEREEKEFLGFSRRGVEVAAPWRVEVHCGRCGAVRDRVGFFLRGLGTVF
jgi:hypothetical protein